ncbi:expressed unknown protein [Seminavis robusta]|uniref:Uncharacterized protein n=1 Tax=Seminavis robusta TaxID=568900 RepID=A0A9N8D637_9STRA|nr:expressed unknown protein [Seminavis robusta]|eukprot:Sro14_g010570.1 n/a (133) ;mRNA; r:84210-84608
MKLFGSLRIVSLYLLLVLASLPQGAESLNFLVNYNATTMWLYNYFRAYLCTDYFGEEFCSGLAREEDMDILPETEPENKNPTSDNAMIANSFGNTANTNDIDDVGGFAAFRPNGGGRNRRNLRAWDHWFVAH